MAKLCIIKECKLSYPEDLVYICYNPNCGLWRLAFIEEVKEQVRDKDIQATEES